MIVWIYCQLFVRVFSFPCGHYLPSKFCLAVLFAVARTCCRSYQPITSDHSAQRCLSQGAAEKRTLQEYLLFTNGEASSLIDHSVLLNTRRIILKNVTRFPLNWKTSPILIGIACHVCSLHCVAGRKENESWNQYNLRPSGTRVIKWLLRNYKNKPPVFAFAQGLQPSGTVLRSSIVEKSTSFANIYSWKGDAVSVLLLIMQDLQPQHNKYFEVLLSATKFWNVLDFYNIGFPNLKKFNFRLW